jgi:hypothetical protein
MTTDASRSDEDRAPGVADSDAAATGEVGSEGGSPGDVEIDRQRGPSTGSEAGETSRPSAPRIGETDRSETGKGRRSP